MNSNLSNIITVFEKMESEGWKTDAILKYGFYFVDKNKDKLQKVYDELEDNNYVLEKLYLADDDIWILHVTKNDILNPEKLHKRNLAFNELADYCEIDLYDGWDVEKV